MKTGTYLAYVAVCAAIAVFPARAGGVNDKILCFSTQGVDRYADGTAVRDGECYALVWSPAGREFAGFNADGTAVSEEDRVLLAAPLARGGRCPQTMFQIAKTEYDALPAGGVFAVCLVDTRTAGGTLAGVDANGNLRRVNRWGFAEAAIAAEDAGSAHPAARAAAQTAEADAAEAGARASRLSALPASLKPPKVTAIEVTDNEVWLAVSDTVPYLDYTIISGEKPNDLKEDYYSDVVEGNTGSEIAIGTVKWLKRRFFTVKRAE